MIIGFVTLLALFVSVSSFAAKHNNAIQNIESEPMPLIKLDSLVAANWIVADSANLAYIDANFRIQSPIESDYENILFTARESSHLTIHGQSKIFVDDIVLGHSDLKHSFHFPLDRGHRTSPYGWRKKRMHAGVDIKAYSGDNIYAVFDGVVRMSKYYTAFGNVVVIRHHNGLETLYAHASKLKVKVNDKVKAGDVIALAGRTGRATGDHLHFEVRVAGQHIDPELLLDIKNLSLQPKNLYITMQQGRIFASNSDSAEERKAEIKEALSKKYHTVRSGDTLSRIAINNSTTVTTICRLNNIKSTSTLRIGQRLRVR
ncbi:MAG: M23 family metallopeptidase [Rikenellaceae bacterium]